ncbi:MAG: Zn-dependent hydrolase [Saprospiraceae bacterium]|nr:Zn-dependent hydrolase [Saprospiraceae bacterium]
MYQRHFYLLTLSILVSCKSGITEQSPSMGEAATNGNLLDKYIEFTLHTDLSGLSEQEKQMLPVLIEAAKIMDELFWYEAYGDKSKLITETTDPALKKFIEINYGPWDRLDGNKPFIPGVGPKFPGANFYPQDLSKEEFVNADIPNKQSLYTFIRREADGSLKSIPYHMQFKSQITEASRLLLEAAGLAEDQGLKNYLTLRSAALLNDEYQASDMAWLDMKDNSIDIVIGPIETYEDQLFGYKAAHEAYVLIKDKAWSDRLSRYAAFLPDLQANLPVPASYKEEKPGTDTDLNAYDVIYYAGDCNAGSKTIAINLPNDEEVQLKKGTRRLQLKNAMRAKFDKILIPIADELIDPEQRPYISFEAFFGNTMFHEVAHGLGIKNTINGSGTVRQALKEHASALEEGKADVLGLYMINQLNDRGEINEDIKDYYVTFLTSIFRSVRFGASSAHGKANMVRFNYFKENGAFKRDPEKGTYAVDFPAFEKATNDLSSLILQLQGDGDYESAGQLLGEKGVIGSDLQADLDRLAKKNIPVDVVFKQGIEVLGI